METFLGKGPSEVRQEPTTITNQDVNTSERASKGTSSNGVLHTVYIYCVGTLQYSFASHLSVYFHRKGIDSSVNCNETLDAIEGASAFVVVLSKNFLSSPSCLDNLVSVLQYRRKHGQPVVPVLYGISPSDVAVQEQESDDRIRDWTSALQDLRDLPGIHYREESSECKLVKEIVKDVYEKLFPTQQIGINSRLLEIKQLLCKQPWGIRRIGIWGMPGIGKTTLAKAFFDQISGGYEASCFIKHFEKDFHEKGLYGLLEDHFGKILKEIPRVCSSSTRPSLPGEKISKKRTLVVLDDVQNPLVAESFLRGFHWFGPGSLIIITSRDKRVFRLCQINYVYEVKSLNKNEALQLFSQCAFGKDIEEQNLVELSMEVIDYANGNPLALNFYGRELKGKNLPEMEITFLNFKLRTPNMIHDLLKSSYETLDDNEKDIFLDIACFFKGEDVDYVKQLLEGCGLFPHVGIDVLVEKCLVTLSENRVEMHRIIQNFGRELNNGETIGSERGRRLWEPSTIKFLLEANGHPKSTGKGALVNEDIKSISLDTTNLIVDVKPTAFENMFNLRFLKIYRFNHEHSYGLLLPKGLDSLPYGLRLLHWENYPLQSLPQDFDPGHLVELNMPYSQLQKLWRGTKNLDMLKMVRLCHSLQLTEIDNIFKAQNIEKIDLQGCTKLQRFPATSHLQHLRVVNLSGCREIKSFPEFSPNIEELNLHGTAIRELHISNGNATNLKTLYLTECAGFVKLPSYIGNANNLKQLYLTGCSSLLQLPSSIGDASNLEIVDLSFCSSLMQLPSSIGNATNLENLNLEYCLSLVELPSSIGNATKLKKLCLRGCSGLVKLPSSIGNAISLQELNLEYCSSLVELPSSFGNATKLKKLYLTGCSSLYELPSSLRNSTSLISIDLDDDSLPIATVSDNSGSRRVEVRRANRGKFYILEGEQKNEHSVSLIFHFLYANELPRSFYIPFYLNDDTASKVSSEMVEGLKLTDLHVTFIAELIDIVLVNLIPAWKTDLPVDYLVHSHLNQNSRSHRNKGMTKNDEESVSQDTMSVSCFSWNSDSTRLEEVTKQCVDEIEEEEGSSSEEEEEAKEPVCLEEEERLRQAMEEEIEAKYREELKEIERKREEAIMEMRKTILKLNGSNTVHSPTAEMVNFAADPVANTGKVPESPTSINVSPTSEEFLDGGSKDYNLSSKTRKMLPKWTEQVRISPESGLEGPHGDVFSWRKYGQKDILGAKYPRSYYRCTFRNTHNCWATKQVQRSNDNPTIFDLTYRGTHTCSQGIPPRDKQDTIPNPTLVDYQNDLFDGFSFPPFEYDFGNDVGNSGPSGFH
ncbi:WRKY domain-containing protein [Hirschfeldia incana]|nr:WRKY domain-containing protein [Hirschfeldia incana]